jgi:hypothetical protein
MQAYAAGDYETAAKEATAAASQGSREANRLLGELRETGRGVAQNDALAWSYFQRAAMAGDIEAQYRLGRIHEEGRGVPQSYADAMRWYERASQNGHSGAKARLGKLTLNGRGGKVSFSRGLSLIEEAALAGDPEAETMLAELERKGQASTRKLFEQAPMDQESAGVLVEVREMIRAIGAPPPLGAEMRLTSDPILIRRDVNSWTFILPKPVTQGASDSLWQAASLRLTIAKTPDGAMDVRVQSPSLWRNLSLSGRELGVLEIGNQSVLALWSPARHHWIRHNAQFSNLKLTAPDGQGGIDQVVSFLETQPDGDGVGVNAQQTLRLTKGAFASQKTGGLAFDQIDLRSSLSGLTAGSEAPSPLKGFEGRLSASGLKLTGASAMGQDIEIAAIETNLSASDMDQPFSRFQAGFEASGLTGGAAAPLSTSLPERIKIGLSADRLALKDLANQISALLLNRVTKSASTGQALTDTAFDALATGLDALIDSGAEFKIDEISAKAPDWSIAASGQLKPERNMALPFSGRISVTGQGLDQLIKSLDEKSNVLAVFLDGIRRTTPPKKDGLGNDLFDIAIAPNGAIDINGQRWSQPDPQPKAKAPPAGKKKK